MDLKKQQVQASSRRRGSYYELLTMAAARDSPGSCDIGNFISLVTLFGFALPCFTASYAKQRWLAATLFRS